MFGWRKRKVKKIAGGKMRHRLRLFTNGDFEIECELKVPKDWWLAGVLKIEKRFRKKGLKRVDKLWDEIPIDSKSLSLVEKKLLKEIVPSVLDFEIRQESSLTIVSPNSCRSSLVNWLLSSVRVLVF